jgi:prepilin-type processing-associated H-X9-DG protein
MGLYAFGSWHAGICQFAFADGRVSPVSTTISTVVLERINNRADGAVVSEY